MLFFFFSLCHKLNHNCPPVSHCKTTASFRAWDETMMVSVLQVSSISLSIILLCQMKRKEDTPVVFYSPEAKAGNYDALAESGGGAALYHDGEKNSCVQD